MNKRGQVQTFIFVVAIIFAIGIIFFFLNHLFDSIYTGFGDYLEDSKYNNTEAHTSLTDYQDSTNAAWDYAFLGLVIGYMILLALTAFLTRVNAAFYFIYIIISLFGLLVGTMLSNTWQEIAAQSAFSETITRFPIMDAMLGTYYPTVIMVMLVIFLVVLFGKPPGGGNR